MKNKWLIWLTCALLLFSGWSSLAGASFAAGSESSITVTQDDDKLMISGQTDQQDPLWVPLIIKDSLGQILYFQDVSGAGKPYQIELDIPSWAAYGTAEATLYSTVVATDRFAIEKPKSGNKKEMKVSIRIVGADDEEILKWKSYSISKQSSVYTLLQVACEANLFDYDVSDPDNDGEQVYLVGIDGLKEFDKGPGSGWVYKVNGKGPQTSIDHYTLQPNDKVEFLYTTDMGQSEDVGSGSSSGISYEVNTSGDVSGAINQLELAENVDSIVAITRKLLWDLADYSIEKQQTMVADVAFFLQAAYEHAAMLPQKKSEVSKPLDPDIQDVSGLKVNESLKEQAELKQKLDELLENSTLYKPLLQQLKPAILVPYPSDSKSQVIKLFVDRDAREKLVNAHASIAMVKGNLRANIQMSPLQAQSSQSTWFSVRECDDQEQTKQFDEWQSTNNGQSIPLTASYQVQSSEQDAGVMEISLPILGAVDHSSSPTLFERKLPNAQWTPVMKKLALTKQRITVPATIGVDLVVANVSHSFEDVRLLGDRNPEVQEAIATLHSWGVLEGISSSEYGLSKPLTRAEFFALLTRLDHAESKLNNQATVNNSSALNNPSMLSTKPISRFMDVPSNSWYAPVVQTAVQKGWTTGRGPKTFAPQATMTRAEVAALLTRLYEGGKGQTEGLEDTVGKSIADARSIPLWAVQGVRTAVAHKWLLTDSSGNLLPNASITRGDAALAIYQLMTEHN